MKVFALALTGAVLATVSYASPLHRDGAATTDIAIQDPSFSLKRADLQVRNPGCQSVALVVANPPSLRGHNWRGYHTYALGVLIPLGLSICYAAGVDCGLIGAIVAASLTAIVEGVYLLKNKGHTGAVGSSVRRSIYMDVVGQMEHALRSRGVEFESITATALAARHNDGVSKTTVSMLGVRDLDTGVVMDQLLTIGEDGTGFISVRSTPSDKLARRHDGPGFKISYSVLQDDGQDIDMSAVKLITGPIGDDYYNIAKHNQDMGMNEYIGSMGLGDGKELGFRIIPETDGFGEDYEDVLICGKVD